MLQRKNLLLVEDDTIVLSALCQLLLASDEYIITKAKNCDEPLYKNQSPSDKRYCLSCA